MSSEHQSEPMAVSNCRAIRDQFEARFGESAIYAHLDLRHEEYEQIVDLAYEAALDVLLPTVPPSR